MGFILSKRTKNEVENRIKSKNIDILFNKSHNIYLSLIYMNKLVDINEAPDNFGTQKNKITSSFLKKYFESNHENLQKKYNEWKNLLMEIKEKQKEIFTEKKIGLAQKFKGLVNLMESIIQIQEEKLEKIKIEKNNSTVNDVDDEENLYKMLVELNYSED